MSEQSVANPTLLASETPGPPTPTPTAIVLAGHVVFTLLNSALFANVMWLMPMLVRLHFGSDDPYWRDWQTTLVTAAIPTFLICSIFWGELLGRVSLRRYLVLYWFVAVFPLLCTALAQEYWQLLMCHAVAAVGLAGWAPLHGKLLKHFYSDAIRGRAFAVLNMSRLGGSTAAVYFAGTWLEADADAFRVFFPAAVGAQALAMVILVWLMRRTRAAGGGAHETGRSWAALARPVLKMGQILRSDRRFLRYELAFMTYGAAFMVCDALLPVLATKDLGMRYEDYAHSTQMVRLIAMLIVTLPMGWLLDRLGPIRTSGISFGILALYPTVLAMATGPAGVGVASTFYGLGLAGVMMGWTLGPLTLADSPASVPRYVAIHATLVGVRGVVFQGVGMLLYKLTGSFIIPLALAAMAFAWAAQQMWHLQRDVQRDAGAEKRRFS